MLPWTVVTRHRRSWPAKARNPHITAHYGEVRAHEALDPTWEIHNSRDSMTNCVSLLHIRTLVYSLMLHLNSFGVKITSGFWFGLLGISQWTKYFHRDFWIITVIKDFKFLRIFTGDKFDLAICYRFTATFSHQWTLTANWKFWICRAIRYKFTEKILSTVNYK